MELPGEFLKNMKELLGENEYAQWLESFSAQPKSGLRRNRKKTSAEEFEMQMPFSLRKIPWIDNGYYYEEKEAQPGKHPWYYAGLYYIQEPSAMTPANRLEVLPGEFVLDLCAAPGGKATELGACLGDEGVLVANDISNSRARALLKNLEMQGIGNIYVTSENPEKLAVCWKETFDKILIDAPCSGEGMFRKDSSMISHWTERGADYYPDIQKKLILQGADMLRPGGRLLYSTCTFSRSENEEVIEYLLEQRADMELEEIAPYENFANGIGGNEPQIEKCVRIFPHRMDGEGHFLALLGKKGQPSKRENSAQLHKVQKIPAEALEFLSHVGRSFAPDRLYLAKDALYYLPEGMPVLKGIRYLRTGLLLGTIGKNRFEPSQALAAYLKKEEFDRYLDFSSDDPRVIKYLKGETLDVSDRLPAGQKGWILIGTDGHPLGWGKLANGIIKNKYCAGWRWQ